MLPSRHLLHCALALLFLLAAASTVRAEESRHLPSSTSGLSEVLVTARRREERLLEVPDSVTALGPATIEASHVTSIKDLSLRVPNVSIVESQQPEVSQLNVRGICQPHNGEAPVAMVIDGVQLSHPYQITQALFDIERIEVLKGPQGAMYGRNAIGGAINITTRQPANDLQGMVEAGVGSDSDYTAGGTLSGPLVPDKLLFRVAADYRHFDGDVASPNTPTRRGANGIDEKDVRARLVAHPSERTSFDVRLSHIDTESGGAWYSPVPAGGSPDTPRPFLGNVAGTALRTLTDASMKADVQFERVQLTAVSAFAEVTAGLVGDVDFLPLDGSSGDQRLNASTWSQEVRLASNGMTRFNWLAGLYYLNTHQRLDTQIFLHTDFLPLFGLPPSLSPFPVSATRTTDNNDAYAAFGQLSYRWPTNVELTLALRYDEDRRHQLDRSSPVTAVYERTFESVQPKVSVSWPIAPNRMLYATAGRGFRSGGFNPQARITRIYEAETNYSYEVGFKGSLLDGRMSITGAAFFTHIDDRQVYTLDVINSAQTISNPVPSARVHGVELDVAAQPMDGFELGAALGMTQSRIQRYDSTVFAGLPVAGDFTGNRLLMAEHAAWTFTAYLENALDEQYVLEFLPQQWSGVSAGDIAAAGRGRHWGFQARYRF